MKIDIIPQHIKQFFTVVTNTFLVVLTSHLAIVSVYAFTQWDWSLVVSGFDFSEYSVFQRCLILVPYLILPILNALNTVAGRSLASLSSTFKTKTKLLCQVASTVNRDKK